MSTATHSDTTTATSMPLPGHTWTIGDVEPLLHDLEAQTGILSHVANSPNQIERGELVLIEDKLLDLHAKLKELWDEAWNEHLAFRFGTEAANTTERPAPGSLADLEHAASCWRMLRAAATVTLDECGKALADHPSSACPADPADVEFLDLADDHAAAIAEIRQLYAAEPDDIAPEIIGPPDERRRAARERATALPAATQAGLRAKAAIYLGEVALRHPNLDETSMDRLAASIARDVLGRPDQAANLPLDPPVKPHPAPTAEAEPDAAGQVTISGITAYVAGLTTCILTMARHMGGTMDSAITTLTAGLGLGLEQAHPGAALLLARSGALVASTEPRCTVAEYIERKQAAQAAADAKGTSNAEISELWANRPDGTVLHLARELMKIDARVRVLNECPDSDVAGMDGVLARQSALMDTLIDAPATTRAGWRAKGEVLAAAIEADVTTLDPEHRLATSLAADLMKGIKADR